MKKFLHISPIFILFFIMVSIFGQDQLFDVSKKWYTAIFQGEPTKTNTEVIALSNLTNINDTIYHSVLRSINGNEDPDTEYGYIRNDSGRIYYRESIENYERLFYDFNVKIGDTITVYGIQEDSDDGFYKSQMKLDSIAEASFYGIIRDVYYFRIECLGYWTTTERWIEGIGSTHGLLHHTTGLLGSLGYDLRCVFYNDDLIYKRHPDINCILLQNINTVKKLCSPNIILTPNPVFIEQTLSIKYSEKLPGVLKVYTLQGYQIYEHILLNDIDLDCSEIFPQQGVYLLRIKQPNYSQITFKIVII